MLFFQEPLNFQSNLPVSGETAEMVLSLVTITS